MNQTQQVMDAHYARVQAIDDAADVYAVRLGTLKQQRDRAHAWIGLLSCVCLGLAFGLIYAHLQLHQAPPPTPSELTADPEPLSLAPSEIRATGSTAVWI